MATTDNNDQENFKIISTSINDIETERSSALVDSRATQVIINNDLQKELTRLTAKYGADNERVVSMSKRVSYQPMILAALDQEASRVNTKPPAFDGTGWQLTGRVYDAAGNPVKNMTVFLTEDGKTSIAGVDFSCTPADGSFVLNVSSDAIRKLKENKNLRVGVSDSNQKLVYTSKDTFTPTVGVVSNYPIFLNDGQCTAPPASEKGDNNVT
jgi:hypothetical protein